MSEFGHVPVLPVETIDLVMPHENGVRRVVDCTVGFGGHSSLILKKNPDAELLALDRDDMALNSARQKLAFAGERVRFVRDRFSTFADHARAQGWDKVDAILLDIGVSSPQIDDPERGFSFRNEGPLDMRMDRRNPLTAEQIVNEYSERELTRIFREYGEIREASKLAYFIGKARAEKPLKTSLELAEVCDRALNRRGRTSGPPAPTLAFQALRIAVNDELGELERALHAAMDLLNPGGRIAVISFHSLEDRIVKRFFQEMAVSCKCPPGCPVCICGWKPKLGILTKKPVTASEAELAVNPRAACAKLRAAVRLDETENKINNSNNDLVTK